MKILVFGAQSTIAVELQKIWALREDVQIVIVGRSEDKLKSISQDLLVRGAKCEFVVLDLCKFREVKDEVARLWSTYCGFDLVFLAHGVLGEQNEDEKEVSRTVHILESNFVSHVVILTLLANLMEKQKFGTIAVITSVAGLRGKRSNYIYATAKAAKITFLQGLRARMFKFGVKVVDLRLGFVDTNMTKNFKKGFLWASPVDVAKTIDVAISRGKNVAYVPRFWVFIMAIVMSIPEAIFKRIQR